MLRCEKRNRTLKKNKFTIRRTYNFKRTMHLVAPLTTNYSINMQSNEMHTHAFAFGCIEQNL